MFKFHIKPLIKAKGFKANTQFLKSRYGFSHYNSVKLMNGDARTLNLDLLETMCINLNCTPNDLINYTPDPKLILPPDHELHKIKKSDSLWNPIEHLKMLAPEDINEITKFIQEYKQKKANPS